MNENIESEIIEYFYKNYSPRKWGLWGERPKVTLDTRLAEDLRIHWDDAEIALNEYLKIWNVNPEGMEITHYFEPEFLGSPEPDPPLEPLTVRMLVESAKAGRWLYS